MITDILLDLLLTTILLSFGALITRLILHSKKFPEIVILAFPLGAGIFTWILFLISWIGIEITATTVLGAGFLLVAATAVISLCIQKSDPEQSLPPREADNKPQTQKVIMALLIGALVAIPLILSVGRSYSTWDAIAIWSIKGYGIAREGTIFAGAQWGAHGLSYPQNITLLITSFQILGGDLLPGSKLIFPLFYVSLVLGSYLFWKYFKFPNLLAGLGALLVASVPLVFEHSTIGYANLPFAGYLVLGCLIAIEGISDQDSRKQAISGILLGLSCWTRPEGLFLIPIVVIALFLAFQLSKTGQFSLISWLFPLIVVGGTWLAFLSQHGGTSHLTLGIQGFLQSMRHGQLPWEVIPKILRALLRHAFSVNIWGFVFPLAIVITILNYRKLHPKRQPQIIALIFSVIATGLAMVAFYVFVNFVGELDLWISTGMDRMFLPFGILTAVWIVLLIGIPNPNNLEYPLETSQSS